MNDVFKPKQLDAWRSVRDGVTASPPSEILFLNSLLIVSDSIDMLTRNFQYAAALFILLSLTLINVFTEHERHRNLPLAYVFKGISVSALRSTFPGIFSIQPWLLYMFDYGSAITQSSFIVYVYADIVKGPSLAASSR